MCSAMLVSFYCIWFLVSFFFFFFFNDTATNEIYTYLHTLSLHDALPIYINVDFEDVKTVMTDGGVAIMGSSATEGQNRARRAAEGALNSPLLNDSFISGARYILLNITSGNQEVLLEELTEITDYIQEQSGSMEDMIWGHCYDESLGDSISLTIMATGLKTRTKEEIERAPGSYNNKEQQKEKAKKVSLFETDQQKDGGVEDFSLDQEHEPRLKTGDETDAGVVRGTSAGTAAASGTGSEPFGNSFKLGEPFLKGSGDSSLEPFRKQDSESPSSSRAGASTSPSGSTRQGSIFDWGSKEDDQNPPAGRDVNNDVTVTIEPVQRKQPDLEPEVNNAEGEIEEQLQRSRERVMRLKDLSLKLRSTNGLSELENEPAYKRRNMSLNKVPHSSENQLSRFTVSDDDGEIRPNNSFLHDNVD